MERVPELLKSKIMSADEAAQLIRTGMTIGVSGFTSVGYPKAVPDALVRSGHARDLTICVGAAVGDGVDVGDGGDRRRDGARRPGQETLCPSVA